MIDHFALLGEERRPWIDPDSLKKRFLALSAEVHPDRVHAGSIEERHSAQHRYAELNQAYNNLRHTKERLQHLLELETGVKLQQVQQVPAHLMGFFIEVGHFFKQVDAFLAEKAKTSSPLLQVKLFETGQDWADKLKELRQQLKAKQDELMEEVKMLDARWMAEGKPEPTGRGSMLKRLEELYRLFGYYTKWEAQIQERIVQLSL